MAAQPLIHSNNFYLVREPEYWFYTRHTCLCVFQSTICIPFSRSMHSICLVSLSLSLSRSSFLLSLFLLDHQIFRFAPTTQIRKHNWINFLESNNKYEPAKKKRRRKKKYEWTLASSGTLTSLNKHQDFYANKIHMISTSPQKESKVRKKIKFPTNTYTHTYAESSPKWVSFMRFLHMAWLLPFYSFFLHYSHFKNMQMTR